MRKQVELQKNVLTEYLSEITQSFYFTKMIMPCSLFQTTSFCTVSKFWLVVREVEEKEIIDKDKLKL